MARQVNNNIPVQRKYDADEFQRLVKAGFIEVHNNEDFSISENGLKRVRRVCKDAGILTEVSKKVSPDNTQKLNSINVSLFDKNLLPRIEEFSIGAQLKKENLDKNEEERIFGKVIENLELAIGQQKKLCDLGQINFTFGGVGNENTEDNSYEDGNRLPSFNNKQAAGMVKEEDDEDNDQTLMNDLIVDNKDNSAEVQRFDSSVKLETLVKAER